MESEKPKKTQEMKTDLKLLLECLKYHMGNPLSQKEVLITIHSVCKQNSDAGIYFREIGGLMFIINLAKSSEQSLVKEAALYTLGSIAEENVYCQQSLCTSELFQDLTGLLTNDDSNTNLKRMSVYVLLVLVSNNRNGQTLVREVGCIEVLSQMFRTVLSNYELNLSDNSVFQSYLLWSSVCSTLCVCVNNPQNDENQMLCCSLFPCVNEWLMNCMRPEVIRPICSFIGLTLANNTHAQNCFVSSGGLDVLCQVLVQLESDSHNTLSSAKLAVIVTKTMDACITDNSAAFTVVLSKYHIVSTLLALLLHESLDSREKFSIILAIGHCTEDCEKNQYELLKNNGLPLMIQALTEFKNEDLSKAATYVLHNCKKITGKLSLSLGQNSFGENEIELKDISEKETLREHWKAAKEILCRIKQFEKGGKEEKQQNRSGHYKDNTPSMKVNIQTNLKRLCADSTGGTRAEDKDINQSRELRSYKPSEIMSKACANENQLTTRKKNTNPVHPFCKEKGQSKIVHETTPSCAQNLDKEKTFDQKDSVSQSSDQVLKHLPHTVKNRKQVPETDPFTLCLDIIDREVGIQATDSCSRMLKYTCSGCIVARKLLNSRNFSKFLHSCAYQCVHHKVIMEAEDKYKNELRKTFICAKKILLTPCRRRQLCKESTASEELKIVHQKPDSKKLPGLEAQALNTSIPEAMERRSPVPGQSGLHKKRRIRKDFTKEEVNYLFHGVKTMGNHWNSILWSFPFQKGRRAVDLAHKYHRLIKGPSCAAL